MPFARISTAQQVAMVVSYRNRVPNIVRIRVESIHAYTGIDNVYTNLPRPVPNQNLTRHTDRGLIAVDDRHNYRKRDALSFKRLTKNAPIDKNYDVTIVCALKTMYVNKARKIRLKKKMFVGQDLWASRP